MAPKTRIGRKTDSRVLEEEDVQPPIGNANHADRHSIEQEMVPQTHKRRYENQSGASQQIQKSLQSNRKPTSNSENEFHVVEKKTRGATFTKEIWRRPGTLPCIKIQSDSLGLPIGTLITLDLTTWYIACIFFYML